MRSSEKVGRRRSYEELSDLKERARDVCLIIHCTSINVRISLRRGCKCNYVACRSVLSCQVRMAVNSSL